MENLIEMARSALTGETLNRMSSLLHENPDATQKGFETALPISVAGLAARGSTEGGARALLDTFAAGNYPHVDAEHLGDTVADPEAAEQVVRSSEGILGNLFGGKLGGLVAGLAGETGLSKASATKLIGLAAPLVMGMVGKLAAAKHLDPRGLAGFLGEQRRLAAGALPGSMAGLLGLTPAMAGGAPAAAISGGRRVGAARAPAIEQKRSLMPWILGGLALVAGLWWAMGSRRAERASARQEEAAPATMAPAGQRFDKLSATSGTAALVRSLEGGDALPHRFVVQGLEFRHDSAEIELGTARVLDDVAVALVAHPSARIRAEGHTDNTGVAESNDRLSIERADSVRRYLVGKGVSADRIETRGFGSARPIASNDSAAGRADNRRTEVVLLQR